MVQVGCFWRFRKPDRSQSTAVAQRTGWTKGSAKGRGRLGTQAAASASEERRWLPEGPRCHTQLELPPGSFLSHPITPQMGHQGSSLEGVSLLLTPMPTAV